MVPDGYNPDADHDFSSNIAELTTDNLNVTVGDNEVFVSGDSRTNSLDYRIYGAIPAENIVGNRHI